MTSVINIARVSLTGLLLLTTLVTICVAGPLGVYLALVAALVSLLFTTDLPGLRAATKSWGARGLALSFLVLWLSFLPSARSISDVLAIFDFLAFLVLVPALALLARFGNNRNASVVAALACIGAVATLLVGIYEVRVLGYSRARGHPESSPIFFSGMSVVLSFFCLLGLTSSQSRWRWLLLIGNSAGIAAAVLGGTRGAFLAYAVMLAVFIIYTLSSKRQPLRTRLFTLLALGASLAPGMLFVDASRIFSTIAVATEASLGQISDASTRERMLIYKGAIGAILDSPIWGHGWWHRFEAAVPYLGQYGADVLARDNHAHLHNDILNFGASGGIIAILGYLMLMASPILGAWHSPRTANWGLRVTAATGLVGAYLVMGAVDVMFVFEIPKSMYVLCTAVILGFFLDEPPMASGKVAAQAGNAARSD